MGLVTAAFDSPDLVRSGVHRQRLRDYLDDDTVDPSLLRRLASRDHTRASQVFQALLDEPGFDWEQDGEALLRRHKAAYFAREPRPLVTPLSERLSRAARARDGAARLA